MSELKKIKAKDPVQFKFSDSKVRTIPPHWLKMTKLGKGELVTDEQPKSQGETGIQNNSLTSKFIIKMKK